MWRYKLSIIHLGQSHHFQRNNYIAYKHPIAILIKNTIVNRTSHRSQNCPQFMACRLNTKYHGQPKYQMSGKQTKWQYTARLVKGGIDTNLFHQKNQCYLEAVFDMQNVTFTGIKLCWQMICTMLWYCCDELFLCSCVSIWSLMF